MKTLSLVVLTSSKTASIRAMTTTNTKKRLRRTLCAASQCDKPILSPTSLPASCLSITVVRRVTGASSPHDRQSLLSLDRTARKRPLLESSRPRFGRRAHLPQGQRLYLHLAQHPGNKALGSRQDRID